MKRIFGYSTLFFIAAANLFLFFEELRLSRLSLAFFNSFLFRYRFDLLILLLNELTVLFLQIPVLLLRFWVQFDKLAIQGNFQILFLQRLFLLI